MWGFICYTVGQELGVFKGAIPLGSLTVEPKMLPLNMDVMQRMGMVKRHRARFVLAG